MGPQLLERWEGERFILGFDGGRARSCAPSAQARAAPPIGRAEFLHEDRRDPQAGAATWRACAATLLVSPGGAAAGGGGAATPHSSPSQAEPRGAST